MSFYGSIYYQLIDAFYKVVLSNKGKDKKDFVNTDVLPESFETYAAGRKSVFGFDTGNRWINLNEISEVNPDENEAYSIYEIYHGAPDQDARNPGHGFKIMLDDDTINSRRGEDGIIQLDFHDEFETYDKIYDDAGHIAQVERKVYRLPKAEVNKQIQTLESLVGTKDGYKNLPEVDIDDQHLYGYVDENSKDIKRLEDYVGDWSAVVGNWKGGGKYAPTIAQTVGNIDEMYGDSYKDRIDKHKTFAEIIGNKSEGDLPALYKKLNEENPISLIKAILKEDDRLDDLSLELSGHKNASELSFAAIKAMIGTALDGETVDVYEHIAADRAKIGTPIDNTNDIYDHITTLYDNMNWPTQETGQQKITVSGEISRLDAKIGKLDQTGEATVKSEIDRLDTKIGEIPESFTSLRTYIDDNLEDIDEILSIDLGVNYTIDEEGNSSTAFELIKDNSDNISSIDSFIGRGINPDENSLLTKITNLQSAVGQSELNENDVSLKEHIDNIKEYVGYQLLEEDDDFSLTNQLNAFGELIGDTSLGEGENNLIARIDKLETTMGSDDNFEETVIDTLLSLNDTIGTDEDTKDTLYGKINTTQSAINDLSELVGGTKLNENDDNLITKLSNIHTTLYISDKDKGTVGLIDKVEALEEQVGDNKSTDSLTTQISNITSDIGNLSESLKDFNDDENIKDKNISELLNNILGRLKIIESEIASLKNPDNSLEDESGENPEEQEPIT